MRRIICYLALAALLKFNQPIAHAQSFDLRSKLQNAKRYMDADFKEYSPEKSFGLYMECALQNSAEAMNAVGVMYNSGTGTIKDRQLAREWFQKSAKLGYTKAYYNLGTSYMYDEENEPDFEKAYEYYKEASDMGDPGAWYSQGYMLYKGLGCKQNYDRAFELFSKGANVERGTCMHFLGLCYLNGYGVKQDSVLAKQWLQKSALQGNTEAMKALTLKGPEGIAVENLKNIDEAVGIPLHYNTIQHNVSPENIAGVYKGYLVTYDWSGNKIVQLLPLNIDIKADGDKIQGQWIEGSGVTSKISGTLTESGLTFNSESYLRNDNYNNKGLWQLRNATIELLKADSKIYLKGNLKMFSPEILEPSKPMYITLSRSNDKPIKKNEIAAYPNPCTDKINVAFSPNGHSEISLHSISGERVFYKNFGNLPSIEQQTVELPMNIPSGVYVLKVQTGNRLQNTIILKQ